MKTCALVLAGALPIALAGAQAPQAPIQLQHVDVTNMDTSVSPCDNFYQYVCGKVNAANPIPPDQVFWGVGGELQEWNDQVLRGILEKNEAASATRTPNEQKIGDFYASCVDQTTEKKDDFAVLQPLLAQIDGMHDKREIATVLAAMHSSFDSAWQGNDNQTAAALFGYGQQADYNNVDHVVAGLDQGGLGMPNRDFYLKEDEQSKNIREDYMKWIEALLGLGGTSAADATKDAATIMRIETALAKAQMDNITRRDPNKVNNRFTPAQLKTLVPNFNWDAYMSAIGSPAVPLYEVASPEFFRTVNEELAKEDLGAWKTYLRWHLLRKSSSVLGSRWRDADFAFRSVLLGDKEQPPTWRRCANAVDRNLGEALGQVYVAQVFPPESKARAKKLVKDIESAMGRNIDSVTWMQASTKREAHLKLAAVIDKIGYPDKWIDYSSLSISRESYAANQQRSNAFELKRQLAFIGHSLDRTQWQMTPPTVDAYEDAQTNTINFPAGILQPAYFDPTQDDVINYGAEGAIVGHELTHGFDDQGRKFDVKGNLRDWWTAEDAKEYEQRGECIAKEYTGPVQGISGVEQNGKLTQGEDTADNGGLYLALSALNEDLKQQGKTIEDKDSHGLTNLQRFFIAYGTAWCDQIRPEAVKTLIQTNPHSVPWERVNNVVGNMPEFEKAFNCKAGQPMVHATRCRVW
ncbi:M13 family metallopeptidase [Telmatobacter sp. DSM 110680]|uniref:M13 family metallopeptidase n=1 Tax=Telmatobacter sp. DSM 110680 TaxID=3036704 RepID=A0AAU7DGH4_9BACT